MPAWGFLVMTIDDDTGSSKSSGPKAPFFCPTFSSTLPRIRLRQVRGVVVRAS
jgi:hypothetical protein